MKPRILAAFALGSLFGIGATYWIMKPPAKTPYVIKHSESALDMCDPAQRDLAISYWYRENSGSVSSLEKNTGHKFTKQLGKMYAGPVEILEEQLEFMKAYMKETERLSEERRSLYLKTKNRTRPSSQRVDARGTRLTLGKYMKYLILALLLTAEIAFGNSYVVMPINLPSPDSIVAFTNGLPVPAGERDIKTKEDIIRFLKDGTYVRKTLTGDDMTTKNTRIKEADGIFTDKNGKFYYWTLISSTLLWLQTPEGGGAILELKKQ